MELPVYYTFSDFEKNYKTDLEKFKETYKDASEIDYYEELLSLYNMFPIDIIFADLLLIEYLLDLLMIIIIFRISIKEFQSADILN